MWLGPGKGGHSFWRLLSVFSLGWGLRPKKCVGRRAWLGYGLMARWSVAVDSSLSPGVERQGPVSWKGIRLKEWSKASGEPWQPPNTTSDHSPRVPGSQQAHDGGSLEAGNEKVHMLDLGPDDVW